MGFQNLILDVGVKVVQNTWKKQCFNGFIGRKFSMASMEPCMLQFLGKYFGQPRYIAQDFSG